jgi:hypothetical protein
MQLADSTVEPRNRITDEVQKAFNTYMKKDLGSKMAATAQTTENKQPAVVSVIADKAVVEPVEEQSQAVASGEDDCVCACMCVWIRVESVYVCVLSLRLSM